ncbi:ABC transporter ATP-binding protein [Tuberibacillus sp. Marseille-P3662]|uniref:ABC transporter ATP-binding protein n=1 Tax=Tuberibacillus sp. Marseille-P3662 TaxID=1965358 RepID=UPI000A1CBF8D|nr:ABC transporter ATP-binding protein [Tuberibacillus sp. Marseille-P3662]
MIQFTNVSKIYQDGTKAVRGLDLSIQQGEFFVFIGPSGCGKTTTLKMMNRLIELSGGSIAINEQNISQFDIHELRWNIGYVLQKIALFPHMTIEENIAVVPELKKWSYKRTRKRVDELLDMVGLNPEIYRDRKPRELSGGEQQRIGVIRALAADPDIILMDEPFSALDPITRNKLQHDILDLQQRIKKTIVFVTHDMQEALALGDRIGLMQEGEMVQVDEPEALIQHPANDFVRDFIKSGTWEGQIGLFGEQVLLSEVLDPEPLDGGVSQNVTPLPFDTPLSDALGRLAEEAMIPVEQNGNIIGTISHQSVVQYLADQSKDRRGDHG